MKNHKLGILKVRDNIQSCGEIESNRRLEVYGGCMMLMQEIRLLGGM